MLILVEEPQAKLYTAKPRTKPKTSFSFFVKGLKAKARPRINFKTKNVYSSFDTKGYEEAIAWSCKDKIKEPIKGGVKVSIKAFYKNILAKPDIDNVAKIILDGMNKIAYKDDCQVVELILKKIALNDIPEENRLTQGEGVFVVVEEV